MRKDPPVRRDGRCALKSCRKPRTITKASRQYAGYQVDADPFCSAACAKAFHGVVTEVQGQTRVGTTGSGRPMHGPTLKQQARQARSDERRGKVADKPAVIEFQCAECGAPLEQRYIGIRRFCSPRCRKNYWNNYGRYAHGVRSAA